MHRISYLLIFLSCVLPLGCATKKQTVSTDNQVINYSVVYRMRGDYSQLVPVRLNASQTEVVAFPAPSDLYIAGELALPIDLGSGYYLDRRGVDVNTAFLSVTYDEYKRFRTTPNPSWLLEHTKYKNPFKELYIIEVEPSNIKTLQYIIGDHFIDRRVKRVL